MKKLRNLLFLNKYTPALAWVPFLFIAFKYMRHFIHDPDIWWHLSVGRTLVESRQFLWADSFSHTMAGTPWINFEWLSQIGAYFLIHSGGISGFYFAKVFLGMLCLFLFGFCLWRVGARHLILLATFWFGYKILQVRLCARIELATLLLMTIFVFLSIRVKSLSSSQLRLVPWLFSGLMILWVNLHGGFIYGIGMIVMFTVGAYWSRYPEKIKKIWVRSVVGVCLAALINPFGINLITVFVQHAVDFSRDPGLISEWERPSLRQAPFFWICFGLNGFAIAWVFLKRKRDLLFWVPNVLLFSLWGSRYLRNTAYLAFVAVPFLTCCLMGIKSKPFLKRGVVVVLMLFLMVDKQYFTKNLTKGLVDGRLFPVKASRFLTENNISGRMYNSFRFGGFLNWVLKGREKVFMDGRYIFYPLLVERHDLRTEKTGYMTEQRWQDYFERYGVDYAVMGWDSLRVGRKVGDPSYYPSIYNLMFPRKDWALVFWDEAALIFCKREAAFDRVIHQHEMKTLFPYNLDQMKSLLESEKINKEKAHQELLQLVKKIGWGPTSRRMKFMLEGR